MMRKMVSWAAIIVLLGPFLVINPVVAADDVVRVVTVNVREVIAKSTSGQEARKVLEEEVLTFRSNIQKEQDALAAFKGEIEKKSSAWSQEVRQGKEREYQKKLRDLQMKSEDAQFEMQKLEKSVMEPILKDLHEVLAEVGQAGKYSLVFDNSRTGLESVNGLLYADKGLDITDEVVKALDAKKVKGGQTK